MSESAEPLPEELLAGGLRAAYAATRPAPELAPAGGGSYSFHGEIGRGGMGVILRGVDRRLEREVAIKVLAPELARDPAVQRRFLAEARIAGRLQHPGVVPVYELGATADARPFFSMKLIDGRSLAQLLDERASPAEDLPRFVAIFLSVCQTIAYAHERGILHRDLKPSNVMVGAFGEVLVVDWGLAKVIGGPEPALPAVLTRRSDEHSSPGSVLGTPAFMAPEQARGRIQELDRRTDVFALGALLCAILTGEPPYVGDAQTVRRLAGAAELADAHRRLEACAGDPTLCSLARRCLQAAPEDRPEDAGAVARAVEAHLHDAEERARRARIEAAEARVRSREERKRMVTIAAAVLVLLAAAAGTGRWVSHAAGVRRARAEERVGQARAELLRALGQAESSGSVAAWDLAEAAARGAERSLLAPDVGADLADAVRRLAGDVRAAAAEARALDERRRANAALLARLQDIRRPEGAPALGPDWGRVADEYARAFRDRGVGSSVEDEEGLAAELADLGLARADVAAAFDEWAAALQRAGREERALQVSRVAARLDDDPERAALRAALLQDDRDALREFARQEDLIGYGPATLHLLGGLLVRADRIEDAIDVLRRAQRAYPDDYTLNVGLARALLHRRPVPFEGSVGFYRAALALRPASVEVRHELAQIFRSGLGRHDDALAFLEEAVALRPGDAHLLFDLGTVQALRGESARAEELLEESLRLDPNDSMAWTNLGQMRGERGALDQAVEAFEEALRLDPENQPALYDLGGVLWRRDDVEGAAGAWEESVRLAPNDPSSRYNLALAYERLGDRELALEAYRAAARLAPDHAGARLGLGNVLWDLGRLDEAAAAFREALRLRPDYPEVLCNLGRVEQARGNLEEAVRLLQRGHDLGTRRGRWPYPSAHWLNDAKQALAAAGGG